MSMGPILPAPDARLDAPGLPKIRCSAPPENKFSSGGGKLTSLAPRDTAPQCIHMAPQPSCWKPIFVRPEWDPAGCGGPLACQSVPQRLHGILRTLGAAGLRWMSESLPPKLLQIESPPLLKIFGRGPPLAPARAPRARAASRGHPRASTGPRNAAGCHRAERSIP